MDAMSDICNRENYNIYEYPPPDMHRGCEAFINDWEEVVEEAMINRSGNHLIENELCYKTTEACIGVDLGNIPKIDDHITVDGKKVPIVRFLFTSAYIF